MANTSITCRVLTFCSTISEKADKISVGRKRRGKNKDTRDEKDTKDSKDDKETNVVSAERDNGGQSRYSKVLNTHYILTLGNDNNNQYKAEATTSRGPKEVIDHVKSDKIIEKNVITEQPKKIIDDEAKPTVFENLSDLIMKQPQKKSIKEKINIKRNKVLARKFKMEAVQNLDNQDQQIIKLEKPRKMISIKNAKYFFKHNRNEESKNNSQKQVVEIYQNCNKNIDLNKGFTKDVTQENNKGDCVALKGETGKIKSAYISKSVDNFYFNRNTAERHRSQKRAKVKSNKKKHAKRKTFIALKPSRSNLLKVPAKQPVKKKKSKAKINLDYFRRKISFHFNSSSFSMNSKHVPKKRSAKASSKNTYDQKSQQIKNNDVQVLFSRQDCKPKTSSKNNLNLRQSHSSDIFGFRKSNISKPMVYYKCSDNKSINKRRSCPDTKVRMSRSLEYNLLDHNAYLPCLAQKVKKVKQIVCEKCRRRPVVCPDTSESKCNVSPCKEKTCSERQAPVVCQPKEPPPVVCPSITIRPPQKNPPKVCRSKERLPRVRSTPKVPRTVRKDLPCDELQRQRKMNPCKDVPCESKYKTLNFPKDGTGDSIAVYRLKATSRTRKKESGKAKCGKSCAVKYSRKLCCPVESKQHVVKGEGDVGVDPRSSCDLQPESALAITIRSCLICMVMICWLPCIFVVFLCWLITYPMRPHARESKEKKPILESFINWIKTAKWFNLSFLDVFWSMTHESNHNLKRTISVRPCPGPEKEPISVCCMTQSQTQSPCKSLYPNKNRQYTLAHTTSRGWVMRPVKVEKMPPSILKKGGQTNRPQRALNYGAATCPPCGVRDVPRISRRCQAGMQGICIEQRLPAVAPVQPAKVTKCSCSQVTPRPSLTSKGSCVCPPAKNTLCTCNRSAVPKVCATRAQIGVCHPMPKPTCKCKIGFWTKYWRNTKKAFREFAEFEKGSYNPNATCGEMYLNTMKNKPCFWVHECCPNMYPLFLQLCSMYRNCCHGMLLFLSACIWIPWMLCCYLCVKFCCACLTY